MGIHTWFIKEALPDDEWEDEEEVEDLHDLFRARPKDLDIVLLTPWQTFSFCEAEGVELNDYQKEKIEEFFKNYPNGKIEFF